MGGYQADTQQVKETEAGNTGETRISSSSPSKDALVGPDCMFRDNPAHSTHIHQTSLDLERNLENTQAKV